MSTLNPTTLETADYGTTGWNAIYSSNFQKINTYLAKIQDAWDTSVSKTNGDILIYNSSSGTWIRKSFFDSNNKIALQNQYNSEITSTTSNMTLGNTNTIVLVNASSGNITITLPSAPITGKRYTIKKIDNSVNVVIITSTKTIDGQTSITISNQYEVVNIIYDGNNYYIV